jgi:hypothetical protein
MDILCSDKTGTLTLNQLSIDLDAACPMGGLDTPELIKAGALSADTVAEEAIDMVRPRSGGVLRVRWCTCGKARDVWWSLSLGAACVLCIVPPPPKHTQVLHNTYPDKDNLWAAYRRIKCVVCCWRRRRWWWWWWQWWPYEVQRQGVVLTRHNRRCMHSWCPHITKHMCPAFLAPTSPPPPPPRRKSHTLQVRALQPR